MKSKVIKHFIVVLLGLVTLWSWPVRAELMISPIYVIFDDKDRVADITLINTGDHTSVYRLAWSYKRQLEDGTYQNLDEPLDPAYDPGSFIRFSPKQVTLPPQGRQKIRLQLRKPEGLPPGEYRAHLEFKRLPDDSDVKESTGKGISMRIRVFLGIAVPIIVRQGDYDAEAKIADVRFVRNRKANKSGTPELMVKVARTGKQGTYGRLRVFWQNGSDETQIGILNNYAIYSENPDRVGYVPLSVNSVSSGSLRIVYEGDGPQRGKIFAERIMNIGG